MENLKQQWHELMAIPGVAWVVYISLLIVMVLIAIYVLNLLKNLATGQIGSSREEDFNIMREIHGRGMIADEEFERAKQLLNEKTEVDELPNVKQVDAEKE